MFYVKRTTVSSIQPQRLYCFHLTKSISPSNPVTNFKNNIYIIWSIEDSYSLINKNTGTFTYIKYIIMIWMKNDFCALMCQSQKYVKLMCHVFNVSKICWKYNYHICEWLYILYILMKQKQHNIVILNIKFTYIWKRCNFYIFIYCNKRKSEIESKLRHYKCFLNLYKIKSATLIKKKKSIYYTYVLCMWRHLNFTIRLSHPFLYI